MDNITLGEWIKAGLTTLFLLTILIAIWDSIPKKEKPKSKALLLLEAFVKNKELTKYQIIGLLNPNCGIKRYINILKSHDVVIVKKGNRYIYIKHPWDLRVDDIGRLVSNWNNEKYIETLYYFDNYIRKGKHD